MLSSLLKIPSEIHAPPAEPIIPRSPEEPIIPRDEEPGEALPQSTDTPTIKTEKLNYLFHSLDDSTKFMGMQDRENIWRKVYDFADEVYTPIIDMVASHFLLGLTYTAK